MIGFERLRYRDHFLLAVRAATLVMSSDWNECVSRAADGLDRIVGRVEATGSLVSADMASLGVVIRPSQAYYWSPEWQEAEREAIEELRRGESVRFEHAEEAIRWLSGD